MNKLYLTQNKIESTGWYNKPCNKSLLSDNPTYLMGPNGFELTELEIELVKSNDGKFYSDDVKVQKSDWITQPDTKEGVVLNHSFILYRRSYNGDAGIQLQKMSLKDPRINRIVKQKPRWGLDISLEFIDKDNVFEIVHWEYDTDSYEKIEELRDRYEPLFLNTDWQDGAKEIFKRKDEWINLGFFPQSKYKCEYFGLIPENFGQVRWI
jgi:hypothetical protein